MTCILQRTIAQQLAEMILGRIALDLSLDQISESQTTVDNLFYISLVYTYQSFHLFSPDGEQKPWCKTNESWGTLGPRCHLSINKHLSNALVESECKTVNA